MVNYASKNTSLRAVHLYRGDVSRAKIPLRCNQMSKEAVEKVIIDACIRAFMGIRTRKPFEMDFMRISACMFEKVRLYKK
jgi:hypothetical protein